MKKYVNAFLEAILGLFLIGFDQCTKKFVIENFSKHIYQITPWLSVDLTYNRGLNGGLFATIEGAGRSLIYCLIAVALFIVFVRLVVRFFKRGTSLPDLLIFCGGISNFFDRLIYKGVVDFIAIDFGKMRFSTFNCADLMIVFGLLFLFWELCFYDEPDISL